jgi:chemotaxis protein CheX
MTNTNKELLCQTFIDSTADYFKVIIKDQVKIGTPYINEYNDISREFCGQILINGASDGIFYIAATSKMLVSMIQKILNEKIIDSSLIPDLVGEIANVVAGNARAVFGNDFIISIPKIILPGEQIINYGVTYVVPVFWENHNFYIAFSFKD